MNLGEYAESLFTTICTGEGYAVSKPFYHEVRYDLVVDVNNALHRVQVKSTDHVRPKAVSYTHLTLPTIYSV